MRDDPHSYARAGLLAADRDSLQPDLMCAVVVDQDLGERQRLADDHRRAFDPAEAGIRQRPAREPMTMDVQQPGHSHDGGNGEPGYTRPTHASLNRPPRA